PATSVRARPSRSCLSRRSTTGSASTTTSTRAWSRGGPRSSASKNPGSYADRIQVEVRPATSGQWDEFDLAVIEDGVYREAFPNLSMDTSKDRYIERVMNHPKTGSL